MNNYCHVFNFFLTYMIYYYVANCVNNIIWPKLINLFLNAKRGSGVNTLESIGFIYRKIICQYDMLFILRPELLSSIN